MSQPTTPGQKAFAIVAAIVLLIVAGALLWLALDGYANGNSTAAFAGFIGAGLLLGGAISALMTGFKDSE